VNDALITLPPELVAIPKFPGYFYDPATKQLYSIKMTGLLHPMAKSPAITVRGYYFGAGYNISKNGRRRRLTFEDLAKLSRQPYQIPYERKITCSVPSSSPQS
jgi:hypothetical protein